MTQKTQEKFLYNCHTPLCSLSMEVEKEEVSVIAEEVK